MAHADQFTFYDEHPFDWVIPDRDTDIRSFVSPLLVKLIESLDVDSLVLDVGCGPGRVLGFLSRRGLRCIGIDRSRVSIARAVTRFARPGVVADNLHLPIADSVADVIISDGVIHHTADPRAAFTENLRILKPGGKFYLGVYKPSGRYPFLYKFPGRQIRYGLRHRWTRPLVIMFAELPYFLIHFVRARGKRTWTEGQNLFYDYFVTPTVTFLSRESIEEWCAAEGARVISYDDNRRGNVHCFVLSRESPLASTQSSNARNPGNGGSNHD
jgi:SAM-dependent methyltransferase